MDSDGHFFDILDSNDGKKLDEVEIFAEQSTYTFGTSSLSTLLSPSSSSPFIHDSVSIMNEPPSLAGN